MDSLSLFFKYNNTDTVFIDKNHKELNGLRIAEDKVTLLRFINGKLDGDQFDENGNLRQVKPAVEGPGRIEFWRQNKLHHDDGLPAVRVDDINISQTEYWENGIRIK